MSEQIKKIELTKGFVAIIDADQWEVVHTVEFTKGVRWTGRICDMKWQAAVKNHTIYATSTLLGSIELRLHRVLRDAKCGQLVDHFDGCGLNNRLSNLRVTDHAGNARNRRMVAGRKSGFKGVAIHSQTGKFEGYIKHNGKKIHLGLFSDPEVAAKAYDAKAAELFGEFANLNFPRSLQSSA